MASIKNIHLFITQMPKPIRYTSIAYVGCVFIYNTFSSYADAKKYLHKYRNNLLNDYEEKHILSDWDAVKYGAQELWWERFWYSIVWPISVLENIVPSLVLYWNPSEKGSQGNVGLQGQGKEKKNQ